MTSDPREGVDDEGFLVTGVDLDNVRPPYDAVLADARHAIGGALRSELHGLYLYGSVATGRATPPGSDLDLAAVVTTEAARERCRRIAGELSDRHRETVREVGIAAGLLDDILAPNESGRAERCFLKHYCVNVAGVDLSAELDRCRPDASLARGFVADLEPALEAIRERLAEAETPAEVEDAAGAAGRRLLLAASVLYSAVEGRWTTDRAAGAEMLAARHPDVTDEADLAMAWSRSSHTGDEVAASARPGPRRADVADILDRLGSRIRRDIVRHLAS